MPTAWSPARYHPRTRTLLSSSLALPLRCPHWSGSLHAHERRSR
jgi:hypothetical protein